MPGMAHLKNTHFQCNKLLILQCSENWIFHLERPNFPAHLYSHIFISAKIKGKMLKVDGI